jgi:hypothetical protein
LTLVLCSDRGWRLRFVADAAMHTRESSGGSPDR